ncbi:MAG: outer membrane protein assembly factor BamA [Nitrospirae bacterium]|nr:outer membrane protein assembly factor BamA [Nitrospirota bacterium]
MRARTAQTIRGRRPGPFFLVLCFWVLVSWTLLSAGRPAVAVAQSFEGEPIISLEVNSRVGVTLEVISRLTGIRTGIPYSGKAVRQSLDSLYATGLFTDVVVDVSPIEGGVAVVYQFAEKAILSDLRIEHEFFGSFVFWNLREALGLTIGEEFTEERWKNSIARLVNFLHRQGYLRAKLDTDVSQIPGTNQVKVKVKVNEGSRATIRETKFTGDTVYSNLRLWSQIRSNRPEFYRADTLEEDLTRLENFYHNRGYLKAVIGPPETQYQESTDEVVITIPVEAGPRLKVRFDGNGPFTESELAPLLLFEEERSYDEAIFRASTDRITDFYHSQGYPFAKTDYTREEVPNEDTIQAVFTIHPRNFACLRTVLFYGNTFFSPDRLQEMIQTRPGNTLFCGMINPDQLEDDAKAIRARYHEQGFQQIRIEPRIEYNEAKTLTYLIFAVAEGPRTQVADVQFEGHQALTSILLQQAIRLRPGQAFDEIPLRKDQEEILVLYHQLGYIYARVDPQLEFSDDHSRVTIRYRISEDELARIGRILLNGNTFTHENVIRRELLVKPGDPYDETRIQLSRRKIQQLGYLGNVRLEPINPISHESMEPVKDMRLTVQERPTKTLDLGVGYADVERLRGFVEGTHRNLWGTGRSLTLRAEGSQIERKYSTTYREPWVLGYPIDGRLVAFDQTQVRSTYSLTTVGGTAGLEKNLTPTIKTSLQYQFENNRFNNVVDVAGLLPEDKRANIASLNPGIVWDTRNDPFNPTSGFINGLTFRDAALSLGSQVQLLKATAQSSWFYSITRWLVLAVSARAGDAERFGQTKTVSVFGSKDLVPPSERFFLGGRSTVRGYQQDELGIVNDTMVAKSDGSGVEFIGGNAMLLFNGELRLFLPGGLGLVFFNDRGNVFRNYKNTDVNLLKSTIGAGIWWNLFGAPIRLDYGFKLNREKDLCIVPPAVTGDPFTIEKSPSGCATPVEESRGELHFTLGFAF